MKRLFVVLFVSLSITSFGQTYYIVRHAEKALVDSLSMMSADPPLSPAGKERAIALKKLLNNKKVGYIFSTNTVRTRFTAEPLSQARHIQIQLYGPKPDSTFISQLKKLKGNVLVVGHSNTVDDLVNGLCGEQLLNDLPDAAYDNLFIVMNKEGKYVLTQKKYGKKTAIRESRKRE